MATLSVWDCPISNSCGLLLAATDLLGIVVIGHLNQNNKTYLHCNFSVAVFISKMADSIIRKIIKELPDANGFAVIISNDYKEVKDGTLRYLQGAEKDSKKMESTFKFLKFAVHHIHNCPIASLMDVLQAISQHRYPPSCRRLAIVFSGHGTTGYIYAGDGNNLRLEILFDLFSNTRAPHLGDIPKMFFIDACRGSKKNIGTIVPRGGKLLETKVVPQGGNTLVAYSTILNYMSYETADGGMWMSKLAEKLKTDSSICDILTNINSELIDRYNHSSGKLLDLQQPTFHSQLNEIVNLYSEAHCSVQHTGTHSLMSPLTHTVASGPQSAKSTKPTTKNQKRPSPAAVVKKHKLPQTADPRVPSIAALPKVPVGGVPSRKKEEATKTGTATRKTVDALLGQTAKEKLVHYVTTLGRPKPSYEVRTENGMFEATVYVAHTGRTTGPLRKTKGEAEEAAASKMLTTILTKLQH